MRDGVFHGVVVDHEGELGYGRLWFYYALDYRRVEPFGGRLAAAGGGEGLAMGRLKVTSIGWDDDDVTDDDLEKADVDKMSRLVLRLVTSEWPRIRDLILASLQSEGGDR